MMQRAATYCRKSNDPNKTRASVESQAQICARLAAEHRLRVVAAFEDNDISAAGKAPRPDFLKLIAAIGRREFDVVIAWETERLYRRLGDQDLLFDACEDAGLRILTAEGWIDPSSDNDRLVGGFRGVTAHHSVRETRRRVRDKLEARAREGLPHGRRCYGWDRVLPSRPGMQSWDAVNAAQALVVRRLARHVIDGCSLASITAELNAEEVPSPSGKPWAKNMVRALLLRPRNAGLRVHHGEVIGPAAWDPILERGEWEQVVAILSDPQRRTSMSSAAKHLLSGIAVCGVCGSKGRGSSNRGIPSYKCAAKSCISRRRADVDVLVERLVIERLSRPDMADAFAPDTGPERAAASAEAQGLRARLKNARKAFANGALDLADLTDIKAVIGPLLEEAEARSRVVDDAPLLDGLIGRDDTGAAWQGPALSRERQSAYSRASPIPTEKRSFSVAK